MMKVHELIQELQTMDPDACVYLMSQQRRACEIAIYGLAVRADFSEDDDDPSAEDPTLSSKDVFIVEGSELRYGNNDAWKATWRRSSGADSMERQASEERRVRRQIRPCE